MIMKAFLLKTDFGIDNLVLEDVPEPKPGPATQTKPRPGRTVH
jgi:hypothetical protein